MFVVEGWVRLAPEDIARFTPAAIEMMRASRDEPGCIDYAFSVEVGEPGLLRVVEKWKDQAALDYHFTTPHMAAFQRALGGFALTSANVVAYEAADHSRPIVVR